MKSDLERYAKELEFMRWESTSWRRRELELQNQVNYLSHQLQTIAASFSQVPSKATSASSPALPQNGTASSSSSTASSSANASPAKNGYHVPLPSQNPPQPQPSSLHIIPPSSGLFSPIPMVHSPMYYSYAPLGGSHHSYPHFPTQNQPHPHSFTFSASQPANLMSVFSPNGNAGPSSRGAHSGPSSAPDSPPSIGSLSPDSANLAVDRGRRRMRGKMHMGGWPGIGTEEEDGYLQEGGGCDESSDDDESEVSGVLADAILKRPGTLKLGKSRSRALRSSPGRGKDSPDSESQAEFTFPSLSTFGGNIRWDKKPKDNDSVGLQNVNGSTANPPSLDDLEKVEQLDVEAQMEHSQSSASELPAG
ncbi:hypothetical protein F5887DRAFT_32836 [Amanita rubescens]|nr:hypothetical protein F5887DRAFT_32836 [Amanita rubescens]